jgi:cytochrome oxidase Cu insertion factor (SCO1/SenC/PrrC family)
MRTSFALCLVCAFCLPGCRNGAGPVDADDDLGPIADFTLVERSGRSVQRDDLLGKVWVAAFVFTRCAGPCSQVSGCMARLQHELAGQQDVMLVSFTVDPDYDTPAVLQEYAGRFQADPKRWLFLTGEREPVYRLVRDGFHLTAQPNEGPERTPGNEVMHDTRLALVDRRGHLRLVADAAGRLGYADALDPDAVPRLLEKITALLREKQ